MNANRTNAIFCRKEHPQSPSFPKNHYVDIVGVTGSIPVTPTILFHKLAGLILHLVKAQRADCCGKAHHGEKADDSLRAKHIANHAEN